MTSSGCLVVFKALKLLEFCVRSCCYGRIRVWIFVAENINRFIHEFIILEIPFCENTWLCTSLLQVQFK